MHRVLNIKYIFVLIYIYILPILAIDSTNKIYVGAQNEVGHLVADSIGIKSK